MPPLGLSAIVPTLNEARHLERCLASLGGQEGLHEVLAVDGGSADGTAGIAAAAQERLAARGIALRTMLARPPGRAAQMNAGAAAARGDVLMFVHADTVLPPGAARAAARAVGDGHVGGAFRHRFLEPDLRLSIISRYANLRSRLSRIFFGDQAIFVSREVFEELRGFRPIPIMEDLEFSRRLRRRGSTVLLADSVRTSGRRFLSEGVGRTCARMILLRAAYRLRVDPLVLTRHYREVR